jgi:hypothetical protein
MHIFMPASVAAPLPAALPAMLPAEEAAPLPELPQPAHSPTSISAVSRIAITLFILVLLLMILYPASLA